VVIRGVVYWALRKASTRWTESAVASGSYDGSESEKPAYTNSALST
jgi:hypothetical protein